MASGCFTALSSMNDGKLRQRSVYNSKATSVNREQCTLHLSRPISLCDTPRNGSYIYGPLAATEPLAMEREKLRNQEEKVQQVLGSCAVTC